MLVLLALMFFTLLTVGASIAEQFFATTFNVEIPAWVNVIVALSIAAVKTTLVVMFFMQLRYDSPINTMIFIFTLLTVAFFLGFTMMDLGNRSTIDRFKGVYIVDGGTGLDQGSNIPITEKARLNAEAARSEKARRDMLDGTPVHADHDDHHAHDSHAKHVSKNSNAQQSRPVKGSTLDNAGGH